MTISTSNLEKLDTQTLKYILKNAIVEKQEETQADFLKFVKTVWPEFVEGNHHKIYAEKLNRIANGELKRLIVNMPPRHTKSEFASHLFPAFFMGRHPKAKLIQTTHTGELAIRFGRKAKNLIESSEYEKVFPEVTLAADSKAAGRWESNHGGEYFAAGVGGAITGRGADLLIIDDPHSEQDALSPTVLESHYEWYTSGPRQRLQPGGAIVLVMTRWSVKDLTGKLLDAQGKDENSDQWEIVEFPAIIEDKPMWGNFWSMKGLQGVKASIPLTKWQAQWMQQPTSEEGALIKREWWQTWKEEKIPDLEFIIQSYDTAFSAKETADYSAITTWGVFDPDNGRGKGLILLDAKRGRWNFPELKKEAMDQYKYWEPEMVLIEAKASGMPLTHELQKSGIPVINFTPSKGNDKHTRVNSVAPLFEAGAIWAPKKTFAEEVIEECAAFPFGDNDDYVDSTTQALMRYRQGYHVTLSDDFEDEPKSSRHGESILLMVDEVTIEDLKPKEDKFTLSDFFTDDDDVVTDLGDDISLQDISSEDPQGFFGGLGATGVDLLRDYRNTLAATGEGISTFMPGGNYFLPEMFKNMMYEDPEGDVLFPLQDNALDIARDVGNYIYPPSEVDEDNPYKDMFRNIRLAGNVIPALVGTVGSRGQVGLPFLMKHLNPTIQKTISQLLPKMSGQGKFFSKKLFREPNTMRNVVLSQMTNPDLIRDSMTAEAAPINTGIQDRNYAVFDDYMQDRMSNLRNQRTTDQGPRQPSNRQPGLDDYRGL